jgi:hypothetical protein
MRFKAKISGDEAAGGAGQATCVLSQKHCPTEFKVRARERERERSAAEKVASKRMTALERARGARKARRHLNGISACCSSVCAPQPQSQQRERWSQWPALQYPGQGLAPTRTTPRSKFRPPECAPPPRWMQVDDRFCSLGHSVARSRGAVPVRWIHSSSHRLWIFLKILAGDFAPELKGLQIER